MHVLEKKGMWIQVLLSLSLGKGGCPCLKWRRDIECSGHMQNSEGGAACHGGIYTPAGFCLQL